jgi:hypothetical protein
VFLISKIKFWVFLLLAVVAVILLGGNLRRFVTGFGVVNILGILALATTSSRGRAFRLRFHPGRFPKFVLGFILVSILFSFLSTRQPAAPLTTH